MPIADIEAWSRAVLNKRGREYGVLRFHLLNQQFSLAFSLGTLAPPGNFCGDVSYSILSLRHSR